SCQLTIKTGNRYSIAVINCIGLVIAGEDASKNTISGCWFGLDPTGTNAAANVLHGIVVKGGASGNVIGGANAAVRNLISGNGQYGICLKDPGTSSNSILGNVIGADFTGTNALGNG